MHKISVGFWLWWLSVSVAAAAPQVAFYYGANPPWDMLQGYDVVVVEPEHGIDPRQVRLTRGELFAYVSVGEIEFERPYAKELPQALVTGANESWRSHVVDQTHPDWAPFFLDRIIAPLWRAGYRGFFLDTLDSFHLIAKTDEDRARQAQALTEVIRALRARYPSAKLIFNRGFEILPALRQEAYAVAAESLFRGWDPKNRRYVEVAEADRQWLLNELERVRNEYGVPVIAIDYTAPADRELARVTAHRIAELGYTPWVTNADHDLIGIGTFEVAPRRVLMLHDGADRDAKLYAHRIHVQAKRLLNDLGYAVDYADVSQPLPTYPLIGRYAGVISWFTNDQAVRKAGVREWLTRQREHGMRMVVLGNFPFPLTDTLAIAFGLSAGPPRAPRAVSIELRDPLMTADAQAAGGGLFTPLRAQDASATLLRLRSDTGETMDAAALMPWGGYVLTPYDAAPDAIAGGERWLFEPVEFIRRALALPPAASRLGGEIERPKSVLERGTTRGEPERNASERSQTSDAS